MEAKVSLKEFSRVKIIGDLHLTRDSEFSEFVRLINSEPRTLFIQLGDLSVVGYNFLSGLNQENFKMIGGNHDCWPDLLTYPSFFLGRAGFLDSENTIGFFSGAKSKDALHQLLKGDYYPEEELSTFECWEAVRKLSTNIPKIMLSHDCPQEIFNLIYPKNSVLDFDKTITRVSLNQLLEYSKASETKIKHWFFGHHHISWNCILFNTEYKCLNIGEFLEITDIL